MIAQISRGEIVKGTPKTGSAGLVARSLRDFAALESIETEWAGLVDRAGLGSPFVHPGWSLTWAKRFVPEADLEYVEVRDRAGCLVGLAPYYRRRRTFAGLGVTTIQAVGTGHGDPLTEGCHFVATAEHSRDVLTSVTRHLTSASDVDWIHLAIGSGQAWPLPQWLDGDTGWSIHHRKVRPCVVMDDMPTESDQVLAGLKRNLRESLRRARNRSANLGAMEFRCVRSPNEIGAAVHDLIKLHTLRSEMPQKVSHPNLLRGAFGGFLVDAVRALAGHGLASVFVAEHAGTSVAAQLVLSDGSADYMSVSGLDPKYWDLNLNTMLIFRAVQAAVAGGRGTVNLSAGPNLSKMRWSSKILCHHDFDLVADRQRSQLLHQAYMHAVLERDFQQERRRHSAATPGAKVALKRLPARAVAKFSGPTSQEELWN